METYVARQPIFNKAKKIFGYELLYLKLAVCYEKGDWEGVAEMAGILGFVQEDLPLYYMESVYWADSFMVI